MPNIWLLTEECPKVSTVMTILSHFSIDFGQPIITVSNPQIRPLYYSNGSFSFEYELLGVTIRNVAHIILCCASGDSSFCDYLLFYQNQKPDENKCDIPLMVIEETKTSDKESRNSGIFQRGIKFVYARYFYPQTRQYMLYCNDYNPDHSNPTDTNIFGTNIYLNLGIKIIGKEPYMSNFHPFANLNELIHFKNSMAPARYGVTTRIDDSNSDFISMSIRLVKNNGMTHDPGIGTVAVIASGLRALGYYKPIVITQHGLTQAIVNRARGNKLLYICQLLGVQLDGITIPYLELPTSYWHYEKSSEKISSIFLHILAENNGLIPIFHNHAGCEKCYFISRYNEAIQVPKETLMPDVVFYDSANDLVTVIEGKKFRTLNQGIKEVDSYKYIENEYLINANIGYDWCNLYRAVSIFGDRFPGIPHKRVLIYIDIDGYIYVNPTAPSPWIDIFHNEGLIK